MAFETYGGKTSSKKRRRYNSEPIDNVKLKVVMTMFALIILAIGIWFDKIKILFDGTAIENYVFAVFVLAVAFIQFATLGIKRYSDFSKLKGFSNEQYFTFWTTVVTIVFAFVNIMGWADSFGLFANGILIAQGFLLLLEIYR